MLDGYHILTLTHRQVSLDALGRAMLPGDAADEALHALRVRFGWEELMYLATCNRVIYLFYTPIRPADTLAGELLEALQPGLAGTPALAAQMRLLHGADAVRHLLEVAASMDSLVVGEREILRQLRGAFDRCRDWGLTGDHLRLLIRFTIETAKEVYTATGIGEKALSVVALAFRRLLAAGLRPNARVLLIGAGQTNALVAKFLFKNGFRRVAVFNRTLAKAQALAEYLEGHALPLEGLPDYRGGFDALIVCTGAGAPIVTPESYRSLLAGETGRKVVADLAVPNNVDRRVPEAFPVEYIEIEGLRDLARENLAFREQERQKAEALVTAKLRDFRALWHERQVERTLLPVVEDVRAAKIRAFDTVFSKELETLDPAARTLLVQMMDYLEQKSVAAAMRTMKEVAGNVLRHMAERPEAEVTFREG